MSMGAGERRFIAACIFVFLIAVSTWSDQVDSYIYDEEGYVLPCPRPYLPDDLIDFIDLPVGELDTPSSMSMDGYRENLLPCHSIYIRWIPMLLMEKRPGNRYESISPVTETAPAWIF